MFERGSEDFKRNVANMLERTLTSLHLTVLTVNKKYVQVVSRVCEKKENVERRNTV